MTRMRRLLSLDWLINDRPWAFFWLLIVFMLAAINRPLLPDPWMTILFIWWAIEAARALLRAWRQ